MYGCHVVPPNDDGADLGVVFFHNAGLLDGLRPRHDRSRHVGARRGDRRAPRGREPRRRRRPVRPPRDRRDGQRRARALRSVPQRPGVRLGDGRRGCGAHGRRRLRRRVLRLGARAGRAGRAAAADRARPRDQARARGAGTRSCTRSSRSCGTSTASSSGRRRASNPLTQRNVTVFADGEVDRSPCGSGTSARLALLDAAWRLPRGAELRHLSIVGSSFTGRVVDEVDVAGRPAVITEVTGTAYRTGESTFHARPGRSAR